MTIWKDEQLVTVLKGWSRDSEYWAEGLLGLHEETGKAQLKTAGEHIREASGLMKQLIDEISGKALEETSELMGLERGEGGEGIKTRLGTLPIS